MKVKCINPRLNHVAFYTDATGAKKPHKVRVGDTFEVAKIPAAWAGLVVALDGSSASVTNPAEGAQGNPDQEELEALRAEYEEEAGKAAPKNWGVRKLKEVLGGGQE